MKEQIIKSETEQLLTCVNDALLTGNDKKPALTKGEVYPLLASYTCACGELHYNVGLTSKLSWVTCYKCREELPKGDKIHWAHSSRFTFN